MIAHYISAAVLLMLALGTGLTLPAMKGDAMITTLAGLPEQKDSQPRSTRPRTWNKPYYGTPSAQCRRNPGVGSWPPTTAEEVTQPADLASLESDSKDATASSNTILPRQPHRHPTNVNNNILVAFHYTCPQGGAMSQIFMWGVVYLPGQTNVVMIPWHNILGFTGTTLSLNTGRWASAWTSSWCVPHDKLECWYTAQGFTVGLLTPARDHTSIGLVTNPDDHRFAPTVHENCVEIGGSRTGAVGATCIIQEMQINVQGPIG